MEREQKVLQQIKDLKAKSKLSYSQIAEKSGIPESTVIRIFNGKTTNPSISTFISIVKAMGGKAADIFDDDVRVDLDPNTPEQIQIAENVVEVVEEVEEVVEKPKEIKKKHQAEEFFEHCPYHQEIINIYKTDALRKDKWIKALFVCCAVLVSTIIAIFIIDLLNANIGYIR